MHVTSDEVLSPRRPVTTSHVSAMQQPDDHSHPQVMVGIGSGLAPFMAFVQERAEAAKKGPVAPMRLYFGNRFEETEYMYREELASYEKEGWLTVRTTALPLHRTQLLTNSA